MQSVLQHQGNRLGVKDRCEDFGKEVVLRAFETDHDAIAFGHVFWLGICVHVRQIEIAVLAIHSQSAITNVLEIRVKQEVHIEAGASHQSAVEATESAGTNDCILQFHKHTPLSCTIPRDFIASSLSIVCLLVRCVGFGKPPAIWGHDSDQEP